MNRRYLFGILLFVMVFSPVLRAQTTQVIAVRAGKLFDPKQDHLLTNQVVLIEGERITKQAPPRACRFPPARR